MNHTPIVPKRSKPIPTFTIPALLALAGFTAVGIILVERKRTQVSDQTEMLLPTTAPGFLRNTPESPSSPGTNPPAAHAKAIPAYSFTPAAALEEVTPVYPRIAKITRTQGTVEVNLRVNENGHPIQATVLRGNTMLRNEAIKAAQSWKFTPAQENGRAVPSDFRIRFEFHLA